MAWQKVGTLRLYYEMRGTGSDLVLLPGLGMRPDHWAPYLPALSAEHRLIVIDPRGGTKSDCPAGPYTTRQMADDAVQLLDALGIIQADVLGISMGGFIAQELALAYPSRVRRQILAFTALGPGGHGRERLAVEQELRETPGCLEAYFRLLFLWLLDAELWEQPATIDQLVENAILAAETENIQGVRGRVAACRAHDTSDRAHEISAQTLVIGGLRDLVYPPAQTARLAASIPGAQYLSLDCAHVPGRAALKELNQSVLKFLAAR